MKIVSTILTLIYAVTALYTTYSAAIQLFVYFANKRMGHQESFRLPMIYLICSIIFCCITIIGYKIWNGHNIHFLFKAIFYLPIIVVLLYILWAILLIISSGGKWN